MAERYCIQEGYEEYNHTCRDRVITSIRVWTFLYSDGDIETVKKVVSMPEQSPQKLRGLETACYGAVVVASVFDKIGAGLMAL